jgi:hypothetical protein
MVPPQNPTKYKLEERDRLQLPASALPSVLNASAGEVELFCVPVGWRRYAPMPPGREREGWCIWSHGLPGDWLVDPGWLLGLDSPTAVEFALRTQIYSAKYDAKGRLSCAGVLGDLAERSGSRFLWVVPEADSVSIWTDAAFQYSYTKLAAL